PCVPSTTLRQLSRIALALLVMTGRVTMLGISRWAGKGGSYRTVQRFFSTVMPWAILFWVFFRHHVYCPADVYLAAGDEVVATKAGKHTYGMDKKFKALLPPSRWSSPRYSRARYARHALVQGAAGVSWGDGRSDGHRSATRLRGETRVRHARCL